MRKPYPDSRRRQPGSVMSCCILLLSAACFFSSSASAATCPAPLAKLVSIQGIVEIRVGINAVWRPLAANDVLCPGDALRTGANSRAALVLNDTTLMRLDQNSAVTFPDQPAETSSWASLQTGIAHFIARVRQSFEVVTPFMNAGIEGTEFTVAVTADSAQVTVFEGRVRAHNSFGQLILTPGQSAAAGRGQAPVLKLLIRPRDAVQWALYYPAITGKIDPARFANLPATAQTLLAKSLAAYNNGDAPAALAALSALPADLNTLSTRAASATMPDYAEVHTYRAALYLAVGRVAEARDDLAAAVKSGDRGQALALQAIIAVVQNDKTEALRLAQQATDINPQDTAAALALSYARQASFDIPGALTAARQAIGRDDQNALNWARLAELYLSSGDLPAALDAAQRAVTLDPALSRTQTVLGFAWLTRIRLEDAIAAFRRAIKLDQVDPLPRLGLGLAAIRQGRLEQGRRDIEIAASLDPDSSLIRSYLGKAYYDEKRDKVAATELDNAKRLDPFDPTPWFYDALRQQTENQPVGALHALQRSIDLNDNRAVYRSRLLLDSDLAARSASLGRIYGDLGFEQLGLVEGYKSAARNPADYSAHRLLADNYAVLPRHEIARVSELLQSQLLQPLNLTPLQPQLAESNLAILEGAGPSSQSFNEFNPLFTRNRTAFQANAILGSNGIRGDDLVVAGLYDRFSYSLGQFHYQTEGFRDNNDLSRNIYNAFAQWSLLPQLNLQAELRYNQSENGDLPLRFFKDNFDDTLRQERETTSLRLGAHYNFSPRSDLIVSLIGNRSAFESTQVFSLFDGEGNAFPLNAGETSSRGSYSAEVQHLFRGAHTNLTSGFGYTLFNNRTSFTFGDSFPPTRNQPDHSNGYLYSGLQLFPGFSLTAGVSAEHLKASIAGLPLDRSQFNPKLGIVWTPTATTTLRAAAFRTLQRALVSSQTIEPTQIAGFNQFFDDETGTDAKTYGLALDQRFSERLYGGVEYSERDLSVPFEALLFNDESGQILTDDISETRWKEQSGRVYFYWTPSPSVAISLEQRYEEFDRGRDFFAGDRFSRVTTWRTPLSFNYFSPSGYNIGLTATYVNQQGAFIDPLREARSTPGSDNLWLLNASLSYRLPKKAEFFPWG